MNHLFFDKINKSIEIGVEYLKSKQNEDGSVSINNDKRWEVWETANALISIYKSDLDNNKFLEDSINFLKRVQRDDGSFYHTTSFEKNDYCMETTASCIFALSLVKSDVDKGIEFILKKQNKDGSWEIGTPEIIKRRCWPSITGFVLKTLLNLKLSSKHIPKAVDFIIKQQLADGSWGTNWVYYDTPYYSTYPILSALFLYGAQESISYKKAEKFIMTNQNKDGKWDIEITDMPRPSTSLRTALALNSLLVSPNKCSIKHIEKGIKWLTNNQKSDGSWEGGYFVNWPGKKEDIYTTSLAICALIDFNKIKK